MRKIRFISSPKSRSRRFRIIAIAFAILYIGTTAMGMVPINTKKAYAGPAEDAGVYSRYAAARYCLNALSYPGAVTLNSDEKFGGMLSASGGVKNVVGGYIFSPGDGTVMCSTALDQAVDAMGMSTPDFLVEMGFARCDGRWKLVKPGTCDSPDDDKAVLLANLDKIATSKGIPKDRNALTTYVLAQAALEKRCGMKKFKPVAELSPAERALYDNSGRNWTVKMVENDGKVVDYAVDLDSYAMQTGNTRDRKVKAYPDTSIGWGEDGTQTCGGLLIDLGASADAAAAAAGAAAGDLGTTGTAGETEIDDPCGSLPADTQMRWLACGILLTLSGFTNTVYEAVQSMLFTPTNALFGNAGFKNASAVFRNIGIAIIIIAGLIMVIAQATGSEIFDAYTIKKTLPRLGIALVGIAFSYPLLRLGVELVNNLGFAIGDIIKSLSSLTAEIPADTKGIGDGAGAVIFSALALVGVAGGAAILGVWGALSLLATMLLAILLGMFILAIRQIVITVLILMAPLAIAAYVLPGTQKLWSFWKKTFMSTLLMFPIIMLFLKSGEFFAAVVTDDGVSGTLMRVIAIIAPYFMLPMAFKMAGGLMSTVTGMVSDRGRGMFGGLKKFRGGQAKGNLGKMAQGNRFRETGILGGAGRRFNTATKAATGTLTGKGMPGSARLGAYMRGSAHDAASEFKEKNAAFGIFKGNDDMLEAARYTDKDKIRQALIDRNYSGNLDDAVGQIQQAQREAPRNVFMRARARAQAATGTGYHDPKTKEFDASRMIDDINEAYGSDRAGATRALAEMKGTLSNSGQMAGQAGFGTWATALENSYAARTTPVTQADRAMGITTQEQKVAFAKSDAHQKIMDDAILSAQPGHAVYGKPSSARAMGAAHLRRISQLADSKRSGIEIKLGENADGSAIMGVANDDHIDAAVANAAGVLDAMGQASPHNANAFANELMGQGIVTENGTAPVMVRDMIETRMSNPKFRIRRKDYSAYAAGETARAGVPPPRGTPDPLRGPGTS